MQEIQKTKYHPLQVIEKLFLQQVSFVKKNACYLEKIATASIFFFSHPQMCDIIIVLFCAHVAQSLKGSKKNGETIYL